MNGRSAEWGPGITTLRHEQRPTYVYFSHPEMSVKLPDGRVAPDVLRINGIYEISWMYNLIVNSQATYGGEVVQILGANVGPLQVSGRLESRAEQERVRKWFVRYMQLAGLTRRNQQPVLMSYPERGWDLDIYPTSFPWEVNIENFAPEWSISAEIAGDASNALVKHTMNSYTFSKEFLDAFEGIGFTDSYHRLEDEFDAQTIGDNFNLLLSSWITGDYQQFGFNPFGDQSMFDKSANDMYEAYFGSKWLINPEGDGAQTQVMGEPQGKLQVVATIKQVFEAAGIPARYGVAVAHIETGGTFDPTAYNGTYLGLFQTASSGRGGGTSHVQELKNAEQAARNEAPNATIGSRASSILDYYTASMQIQDAAEWTLDYAPDGHSADSPTKSEDLRNWAVRAQGVGGALDGNPPYQKGNFEKYLRYADDLLKQAEEVDFAGPGGVLPNTYPGSPVPGQQAHSSTHETAGLSGYPAYDYMAPTGSPAVSPVDGVVDRLSGHPVSAGWFPAPGGAFGLSIYINGNDGKSYYLTHLDKLMVQAGDRVKQGQQVAILAPLTENGNASHVHMGVHS